MAFRKMVMNTLYATQQKRHRCKNRFLDSVGEGKGGMIWETSSETCILPYVKQMSSPSLMHETGHSKPVHWDNLGRWGWEVGGVLGWEDTCTPVADSCQCMAKTTTIFKVIQFSSVQFSRSVVSNSLQPHESQHAKPPCPSPTPGLHSDSRKLEYWKTF